MCRVAFLCLALCVQRMRLSCYCAHALHIAHAQAANSVVVHEGVLGENAVIFAEICAAPGEEGSFKREYPVEYSSVLCGMKTILLVHVFDMHRNVQRMKRVVTRGKRRNLVWF